MKQFFSKIKSVIAPHPLARYLAHEKTKGELKVSFDSKENFHSPSIPNLLELYSPVGKFESSYFFTKHSEIDVFTQFQSAIELLFSAIPVHWTDISVADVNAFKMGNCNAPNLGYYNSIFEYHADNNKDNPAPFSADIEDHLLNEQHCGINFIESDSTCFKLYGWSPRLILESDNGHHRFAYAAALANQFQLDLKVNAKLEAYVFNEAEFSEFNEMYAQFMIPYLLNHALSEKLDERNIEYISIHCPQIMEHCLLILPRNHVESEVLELLSNEFTDFSSVLEEYLEIQTNSPIYQKYIKDSHHTHNL